VRDVLKENLERIIPEARVRQPFLENRDPERFDALFDRLPASFRNDVAAFSPITVADHLAMPVILIHSTDDSVIPFTETLRLRDALLASSSVSVSLVSIFEHGAYKPLSWHNIRQAYLPSLRDSLRFLRHTLRFSLP
jgi:dipeptidyl aminopeptidase/acylaminoacyl peptidase